MHRVPVYPYWNTLTDTPPPLTPYAPTFNCLANNFWHCLLFRLFWAWPFGKEMEHHSPPGAKNEKLQTCLISFLSYISAIGPQIDFKRKRTDFTKYFILVGPRWKVWTAPMWEQIRCRVLFSMMVCFAAAVFLRQKSFHCISYSIQLEAKPGYLLGETRFRFFKLQAIFY